MNRERERASIHQLLSSSLKESCWQTTNELQEMENFIRNFKSNLVRLIRVYYNYYWHQLFFFWNSIENSILFFLKQQSSSLNLLKTLSAIEYAEAILEITSAKLFGDKFKWILIFLLQLAKYINLFINSCFFLFNFIVIYYVIYL